MSFLILKNPIIYVTVTIVNQLKGILKVLESITSRLFFEEYIGFKKGDSL